MNNRYLTFLIFVFFCRLPAQTSYVATIHPLQQIIRELTGDRVEVSGLLPAGVSPHTYEPTPADVRKIESSDLLFLVGANLDQWAEKFPARHTLEVIGLLPRDSLLFFENFSGNELPDGTVEKLLVPHTGHQGLDPHFWTDPLLVKSLLVCLEDTLTRLYPAMGTVLRANRAGFSGRLTVLDTTIRNRLKPYLGKAVIQAHPFFNYYLRRYGLKPSGTIEINPGVDPTPRQIKILIERIRSENIVAIFTQPQLPDRAARLIAESTGIPVVELDPLSGPPGEDTYEQMMLYNTARIAEVMR